MGRLEGKVALVTGAARGTGEATARRFARLITVNPTGPFPGMRAAIPALRAHGGGSCDSHLDALPEGDG